MLDARLHALRLVAQHGSVTAAAEASGYSPSAVSAQLRSLAKEVGAPVVEPQGRGVRLTEAALVLLDHAHEVAASWEAARARVQAGPGGHLTLCGFSTAAATLLPRAARAVADQHPGTVVRIVEADPVECFDLLLAERADLAVVVATEATPSRSDRRFEQHPLGEDPLDLLVPRDHPLAGRASVSLADAAGEPWIMDRPGRPYHRLVAGACLAAGFTPDLAHEAVEWDTGAALVHAGLGVALVPQLANLPSVYDIVRVPLTGDPRPARHLLGVARTGARAHPRVATALAAMGAAP
ncbi:LysR family transcriptional regulator [Nocardioides sp. CFH 31398]|uniref:LysR family transcriptional regulator n=1 Tax=Nocardioides sp. CFH 31398 TaxID=2919579 RepID=UPI001F05FE8F|nr:LysR family transcriptional regulator [Nocardioides sp. CFH 31398]MCH1866226.1 LysR family transcriptional regulator [Nocardioides sp. CFH 31398]